MWQLMFPKFKPQTYKKMEVAQAENVDIESAHSYLTPPTLVIRAVPNPPWYLLLDGTPSNTPGTGLYNSDDQQRPELMFRILASSFGSSPNLAKNRYSQQLQNT